MHDPSTVAFDVKFPWYHTTRFTPNSKPFRHWNRFITIWHEDPETDGSDDSCGWSYPRIGKAHAAWAAREAKAEWRQFFNPEWKSINLATAGVLEVLTASYLHVRSHLYGTKFWAPLTARELSLVLRWASSPHDNLRSVARDAIKSEEGFERLLCLLMRSTMAQNRPWYRHPKWHVHHWRLQVHPWQDFKRWAFSRCAGCGQRFRWGYAPVTGQWDNGGPTLRGEPGVYHHDCYPSHEAQTAADPQPAVHP